MPTTSREQLCARNGGRSPPCEKNWWAEPTLRKEFRQHALRRGDALPELHLFPLRLEGVFAGGDDGEGVVGVAVAHVVDAEDLAFHGALAAGDVDVVLALEVAAEVLVGDAGGVLDGRHAV